MEDAYEFLRLLNKAMPPDKPAMHLLMICPESGKPAVRLAWKGQLHTAEFDGDDFMISPGALVDRIVDWFKD